MLYSSSSNLRLREAYATAASSSTSSSNLSSTGPSKASLEVVQDTSRLFDQSWELLQKKTFTNWINNQLKQKNIAPIQDISVDLSSGEKLVELLEIIGGESLGRYNRNPKLRIQRVENVNKALDFIRRRGVNLTNIGAEDIVDASAKLILGLIWTIILRFTISEISEEGLTAKEGLLKWCQKRTIPYLSDFFIKDFTFSWQDGLALCGLIHRHRPDLLDYHALNKNDPIVNTQLAFDVAETHLGIPKLFAVEDIVNVAKPDERSVMTYVAQYFHAFSGMEKFDTAGRRVGDFGQVMKQAWDLQNDYETRVQALLSNLEGIQNTWSESSFSGYADAKRQMIAFENYKATTKRSWVSEKSEIDTLLGNIQTKLNTYDLKPYSPPVGLTLDVVEAAWQKLLTTEGDRKRSITSYIGGIKEVLKQNYAQAANSLSDQLRQLSKMLAVVDGDLSAQLDAVKNLQAQLGPLNGSLKNILSLNAQCEEASIEDNEHTIFSVDDLSFELQLLTVAFARQIAFIENQIVARTKTNITPQLLEGYSETFTAFAKDSNVLGREEFRAALQAEGTSYSDAEFEQVLANVTKGMEAISFGDFIDFMKANQEDRTSPDQLKASFNTLANEKDYITEEDLLRGSVPQDIIEYLKVSLPKVSNGYDYAKYLDVVFK